MKTKTKQKKDTNSLDSRVKTYMSETTKLAKQLGLRVLPVVNFDNKKHRPNIVARFGLFLVRKNRGFLDTQFINIRKK